MGLVGLLDQQNDGLSIKLSSGSYLGLLVYTSEYPTVMEMKYEEITREITGCCMKVHGFLGNGFQACLPKGSSARRQEVIYQRALAIEFKKQAVRFEREMEMTIYYDDIAIGNRRVDFFVEDKIMVELKAVVNLEDAHLAQGKNYLEAYNMEIGLLINFGARSLEFKRLINQPRFVGL